MIRAERSEAVCGRCEEQTGGRTIRPVVRIIVQDDQGGGGLLRVLCDPHAGQFAAGIATDCDDARCSCCGERKAVFVVEMGGKKLGRFCRAKCAPRLLALVDEATRTRDLGWARDFDPRFELPPWWQGGKS